MAADAVAEIKARLDIVDVVSGYVSLVRSGRAYKALCPFHSEKTPSFTVSQERQAWYCFGCSEGGDMLSFVEKAERTDFRSALQMLAERAGIEIESHGGSAAGRGAAARRRTTRELNEKAQAFFVHVLWETPAGTRGRQLLDARGVGEEVARRFGVGFAPAGGRDEDALVRFLTARGASLDDLIDGGLAHRSRHGGGRDRFRNRLTFPIRDEREGVVAFGARALGDDQPKYLNSPETAVYHKSTAIYGIDRARDAMLKSATAVVVEGYFDVLAAHVAGVDNAVASSGTALTREQVRILGRLVSTVVLCFDSDDAGVAATSRAVDALAAEGLAGRIVVMPDGVKDPDELVRAQPARFAELVGGARPQWEVLLDRALDGAEGGSVEARGQGAERVVALLARIPEAATRELYLQQASRRLELPESALRADVARGAVQPSRRQPRVVAAIPPSTPDEASDAAEAPVEEPKSWERFIAAAVVRQPMLARTLADEFGLSTAELINPTVRRLVEVAAALPDGAEMPFHALSASERSLASRLLLAPPPELGDASDEMALRGVLVNAVSWVREARLRDELTSVRRELRASRDAGREDEVTRLAARLNELAAAAPRLRRSV